MSATFWETGFVTIQGINWGWKMTLCYVCDNCQMSIFIQSSNVKDFLFYFTDDKDPYWFAKVE